jgi:hypothetical protein
MAKDKFDLVVFHQDVAEVLGFARGLVLSSRSSPLSLAALLMEAAELAILDCKAEWCFKEDKDSTFANLRTIAQFKALEIYHNGGDGCYGK